MRCQWSGVSWWAGYRRPPLLTMRDQRRRNRGGEGSRNQGFVLQWSSKIKILVPALHCFPLFFPFSLSSFLFFLFIFYHISIFFPLYLLPRILFSPLPLLSPSFPSFLPFFLFFLYLLSLSTFFLYFLYFSPFSLSFLLFLAERSYTQEKIAQRN